MTQNAPAVGRGQTGKKFRRLPYGTIALCGVLLLAAIWVQLTINSGRRDGGPPGIMACGKNIGLLAQSLKFYREHHGRDEFPNVKLATGLQFYSEQHGHYPPAIVRDPDRPPRSWRVEMLDYWGQPALAKQYDRDSAWDSAINRPVRETVLPLFVCPQAAYDSPPGPRTDYVLVTGPGTAFPDDRTTSAPDITDGLNQTIILIEIPKSQICWAEPRDISRVDAVRLFDHLKANPSEAPHPWVDAGFLVGFADGRYRYLSLRAITSAQFDGLLTIAGGEPFPDAF